MKASLLSVAGLAVATFSIAPANAAPKYPGTTLVTATGNCSTTTWPAFSPVQCAKPYAHSYVECKEALAKGGVDPSGAWWWCTSQGFKN